METDRKQKKVQEIADRQRIKYMLDAHAKGKILDENELIKETTYFKDKMPRQFGNRMSKQGSKEEAIEKVSLHS